MVSAADEGSHWQDGLICAAMVAVCVLVVHPFAEVALGDDFSYARSALDFARTGHLVYNGWAAPGVGWMAAWGGLFIKLFGFSFTLLRFAMLLLAMLTVTFFHQVLIGFGISRGAAALGALTLGLSPAFLELTASFMTDIPGLLPLVVCLYMCQRAAASRSDRGAIWWLASAALLNLLGGTVRQTTWLGALVMVPATGLLLRRRRGMMAATAALLLASLAGVLLVMHWCNRQPYFDALQFLPGGFIRMLTPENLLVQTVKPIATLMLFTLPVVVAGVVRWRGIRVGVRLALVLCAAVALSVWLAERGELSTWLMPWLGYSLESVGAYALPVWIRWALSVLSVAAAVEWIVQMAAFCKKLWASRKLWAARANRSRMDEMQRRAAWMLGPFSVVYALLLVPRGVYGVFDRYLTGLMLGVVVSSLLLYEGRARGEENSPKVEGGMPWVCWALLAVFAAYGTAGLHDLFSTERARVRAVQRLEAAGVPRTAITADLGSDGWEQLSLSGHVNVAEVKVPAGAFRKVKEWDVPPGCSINHTYAVPDIQPDYIVAVVQTGCFPPSQYAPEPYSTWLPPHRRTVFIGRMHADGR